MSILSDTITATARDAKASEATMRQQLLAAAVQISLMEKTISELETGPMLSKPTADESDGIPEKARDAYRAHRQAVGSNPALADSRKTKKFACASKTGS